MISQLRNNKSLTFYQSINSQTNYGIHSSYEGGLGADAISQTFYTTSAETNSFNNQLNYYLDSLQSKCDRIYQKVSEHLASNPNYTGARGDAVKLAWEYEHADIIMGGKGSGNWNKAQIDEILKMKKVKNAEGHHQKNVASHLHEQGNPNNIKFYKNRNEHKNKGHGGNFKNKSDAPYIDKNDMLKKTNFKRVFKNELRGIGLAAAIGAGIGFTLGFAVTLAQSGVTPETVTYAMGEGVKSGFSAGVQSLISYGIVRTIGQFAIQTLQGAISNFGVAITENISEICAIGVGGLITIAVFSTYQFIKLVHNGVSVKEALLQVGKQALFSLSLLILTISAQAILGGPAGIIVSISTGIIFIAYSIGNILYKKELSEKLKTFVIDNYEPVFLQ